jgi:hypothetical protein
MSSNQKLSITHQVNSRSCEEVNTRTQGIRDSVVGIPTGCGLDDRGVGVRVPVGSRIFTCPIIQIGFGVHPTSYTMGTGGSFPEVKGPGREVDHSPPTSAEVKKMLIYISTAPYAFMAYCLIS